jgi:amidohydrolase
MDIVALARKYAPTVTEIRRDLHAHPELSGEETRTAGVVSRVLTELGVSHTTDAGGMKGIIATIDGGLGPGKCFALRGDMDALPIAEESDVPYKSTNPGVMHACGHDGHTANLLGCAMMLKELQPSFAGRVRLLFQPAEETVSGAESVIAGGGLDGVDAIVMLHGWPDLPPGVVGVRSGPAMASSDSWKLTVHGRGGHAAYPHKTIDPIWVGTQLVQALQGLVAREINPVSPAVVSVTTFHAGTARNVIAEHAELTGTVRTLDKPVRDGMEEAMRRVIGGVCAAHRAEFSFEYHYGTPPVINDTAVTELLRTTATELLGTESVVELPEPTMGAEDFAFYLEKVPGAMCRLGTGCPSLLHTPKYDFGDAPLPAGMTLLVGAALRFLGAR